MSGKGKWQFHTHCVAPKIVTTLPYRDWKFLGVAVVSKAKNCNEMYEVSFEFPQGFGGGGGLTENPFCGKGTENARTTHCYHVDEIQCICKNPPGFCLLSGLINKKLNYKVCKR